MTIKEACKVIAVFYFKNNENTSHWCDDVASNVRLGGGFSEDILDYFNLDRLQLVWDKIGYFNITINKKRHDISDNNLITFCINDKVISTYCFSLNECAILATAEAIKELDK